MSNSGDNFFGRRGSPQPPLGREYWDFWDYPQTLFKQKFGTALDAGKLIESRLNHTSPLHREFLAKQSSLFRRELIGTGTSTVKNDADQFQVLLDVSHFLADEIDVKTIDNEVVVHASHEERQDEHGVVKREFTRRYLLPLGADPEKVTCLVDSNGVLAIRVPKVDSAQKPPAERIIPVAISNADDKTADKPSTSTCNDKENTSKLKQTRFKQSDV